MSENIVLEKSYKFALRIVRLYKYLTEVKKEFVMSKEMLIAGTRIGASVKEAQEAESKPTFAYDMQTGLKYTSRTEFWLRLLRDSAYLDDKEFASIDADREEIRKLITSIVKSSKGYRREN